MRNFSLVLTMLVGLLFAACGGGDDSPAATSTTGGDSPAAGGDSDAGSGGDGDDIDVADLDFPIPLPADAVLVIDVVPGALSGDYPADRYDEIIAFYEQWTAAQAEEYSASKASDFGGAPDSGAGWVSLALEGEPGYGRTISIATDVGPDGNIAVTLAAEEAQ